MERKFRLGKDGLIYHFDPELADFDEDDDFDGCTVKVIDIDERDDRLPYNVFVTAVPENGDTHLIGCDFWAAKETLEDPESASEIVTCPTCDTPLNTEGFCHKCQKQV